MPSSSSLLVEQQQQRRQQQHQESDTGDMEVSSCEENNAIARNGTTNKHTEEGYFLRWSRIRKTVEISDNSGGLMRGSIAGGGGAAQNRRLKSSLFFQSATSSSTPATNKKDILCQVSGYAAPGQILAVMGPSGSGSKFSRALVHVYYFLSLVVHSLTSHCFFLARDIPLEHPQWSIVVSGRRFEHQR